MKLYIYILLFVLLIIYINRQSNYLENFKEDDFSKYNYDAPNPYNVLKTDKVNPIQIDSNSNQIPGFNSNDFSIYSDKYWIVKSKGFSDIYNYEDMGGEIIYDITNGLDGDFDWTKSKKGEKELTKSTDEQAKVIDEKIHNKALNEIVPLNINYKNDDYKLLGTATNEYYNQYYYIFENIVQQKISDPLLEEELKYMKINRIYQYLLVKMHKGKSKIMHWVGPRNKINLDEVIYLSLGIYQLGPLQIKKIN
jgi:hypothetical protein